MKLFIVLTALFALAIAAPNDVEILKLDSDVQPESYSYVVETSDGTSKHEEGVVKDAGSEHAALVVHGSFTYKDEKDGQTYTVNYVADENGFQPEGKHLPQLPKIVTK